MVMKKRRGNQSGQGPLEALDSAQITPYRPDKQLDIAQQQVARQPAKPGVPPTDSIVFSSFDARPIAGEDFVSAGLATKTFSLESPTICGGAFYNYTVPEGYRGILRGFHYVIIPTPLLVTTAPDDEDDFNPVTSKLTVGGPAFDPNAISGTPGTGGRNVIGFSQMLLGTIMTGYQDCYVLCDGGDTIALLMNFHGSLFEADYFDGREIYVTFYGNLIIDKGRALNFEPGTDPQQVATIVRDGVLAADKMKERE